MSIIIVDDDSPNIYVKRSELARLQGAYMRFCMYNADPPSFEEFVKSVKENNTRRN